MLDYVKFRVQDAQINKLLNSDKLDFKGNYSESTGEILENKLTTHFHFCKVEVFKSGSVFFYGSIHKLYNSLNNNKPPNYKKVKNYKGFNGNQFTLSKINEIRIYLSKILYCEPQQLVFENIEIGLNLFLSHNPQLFLTGLLFHHGTQFEHSRNKRLWVASKEDYRIKVYNKSEQYGMNANILRYELHFDRMKQIKLMGIKTFADINKETLTRSYELLIKECVKIIYYDNTTRKKELSKSQRNALIKYRDVRYWIEDLKPNKRYKPKQKLNEIIKNHSDNLKNKILNQIEKTGVIITREFERKNDTKKNKTGVIITHSSIGVNITPNTKRICPVTGLNISMQKESSFLLSNTGLRHIEKTNKSMFDFLVQKLITGNHNEYEKDLYSKLSKQIRNKFYNNVSISINQLRLF